MCFWLLSLISPVQSVSDRDDVAASSDMYLIVINKKRLFLSHVKLIREVSCHDTIVDIYANFAFLSLSQDGFCVFGHHVLFLHRMGAEGHKGTNNVYPVYHGHRSLCRFPFYPTHRLLLSLH